MSEWRSEGFVGPAAEVIRRRVAEDTSVAPSLLAAVFDREGLVAVESRGFYREGEGAPDAMSIYRIASMSKSFCVVAVLHLAEQGRVDLDEPVTRYVPQFSDYRDVSGARTPITVRMLLTDCSGLPEDNAWADSQLGIARADLLSLLSQGLRYGDRPGRMYQYSNLGFAVLGLLVENVTGVSFTHYVHETILEPLGLNSTAYSLDVLEHRGLSDRVAFGYSTFDGGLSWVCRPFAPDGAMASIGGLFSSVGDIATWAAWLSSAFLQTEPADAILSAASRRLMQSPHTMIHAEGRQRRPIVDGAAYGMGLVVEYERELGRFVHHSGGLPGYSSNMRWHPDSGVGVVVFANANGCSLAGWAGDALDEIMTVTGAPARRMQVWEETASAAERIDRMLREGANFGDLDGLYALNVVDDMPFDVRTAQARARFEALGGVDADCPPLRRRVLWAESGSRLAWKIPCAAGDVAVAVEMTVLAETKVQRVTVGTEQELRPVGSSARFEPVLPTTVPAGQGGE